MGNDDLIDEPLVFMGNKLARTWNAAWAANLWMGFKLDNGV